MDIEGKCLNKIKAVYDKSTAYTIFSGERLKALPLKIRNKTRVPILTIPVQHSTAIFNQSNWARKRNKKHPYEKGGSRTVSVCR